jgi:broad specificity phosphatase PhoE
MVKVIIHWVRHGESCSNIANLINIGDKLKHPPLTDKGIIQASYLGKTYLKNLEKYHFIISSPLIRTLMTCFYSISHMYNNEEVIPIYLNPNLDEIPDGGSNLGSVQNSIVPPEKLNNFMNTYLKRFNKNFTLKYTYFPTTNENNNEIDYSKYNATEKMGENINKFYQDIDKMIKTRFSDEDTRPHEIRIICYSHGGFIKELYKHRTTKEFIIKHPLNFQKTVDSKITFPIEDFIKGIEKNKLFNTQMLKEIYDIDNGTSEWEIDNFVLNDITRYNPNTHLVEFVKSLTEKDKKSTCDATLFNQTNELFKNKYMKYKQKYLQLKAQYYKQNKN